MKNVFFLLFILFMSLLSSCVNNVEEPKIDCSVSNLILEIESSVKSDCQVAGSVTVVAEGGREPYSYSANGVDFQENRKIENLFAGNVELFVKDANGCITSVAFNLEAGDNSVSMNVTSTKSDCVNSTGTVTVTATGGTGIYTFSLDESDANDTGNFVNVSAGTHSVKVIDSEGCEITNSITVGAESAVSLINDIMPIVNVNCAISGCHNGTILPNLTSSSAVISNAGRIKIETSDRSMPRGRTLTNTQINQIACWVDAGAKDN